MTEQKDNKANGITGNNQGTIVVGRDGFPYSQHRCLLSAAGKSMPLDAQYVSMRMKGKDISVRSANDVLVWVCKKMSVYQPKQLQSMMKSRKVSWIKVNRIGMNRPYRVTFNCYVDLDGVGPTSLFRAATILKWLSWPKNDVTISYKLPQKTIIDVKTVPPVASANSDVELKDVPSERLVRTILLEMLKQGKDDGETWANFMLAPRCRLGLGLSNSLLHKMKPWETIEEYADEYSVLDGDADYMILSDLGWLDRDEFLRWVQNIGMSLEEICSLLHAKLPSRPVPTPPTPPVSDVIDEKIGVYVKRQLYAALAEDRISDDDFEKLLTIDGTKELLGTTLSACPLLAYSPMIGSDGRGNNSWGDPAVRRGRCVFVNSQWYERHWDKARRLLSRWEKKPLQQAVARANVPSHYSESQIAELLETEFANGIRPGSIIDRNKIRKLYRQHFGEDLPGDFAFDTVLPKVGVVYDGKVFPRPSVKDGDWRDLIERLVGNGSSVFQFSRVMELHAAELMKIGIVSAEMLREAMMREASDTYEISGEVFAPKNEVRLADRFDSVFMPRDGAVIDMTDISKRFPYVDVAFIRNLYKGHPHLVRIDQDRYAILARIDFDDSEVSRGRSYCETAIASDGFFSLAQLRLDDSAAMNDQRLTDNALRRVFFQRFLSDDFDAHGQIVCAKGASIDGQIPLHAFLNDRSEVSLDQIESVAKEYNIAPWLAFKTAHEEMVRIDRDRFIAKGLISFDVAAIDDSIADVCEGYPRPFGAFANLSDFPAVPGFSWNEYLLEAFLRRLSVRFRLVSPSVPARDVSGAVVPRSADLPCAEDAFAAIALRCGVAAETEEVGDFLVATQCVLRRSAKTVGAVVSRMKELEKR